MIERRISQSETKKSNVNVLDRHRAALSDGAQETTTSYCISFGIGWTFWKSPSDSRWQKKAISLRFWAAAHMTSWISRRGTSANKLILSINCTSTFFGDAFTMERGCSGPEKGRPLIWKFDLRNTCSRDVLFCNQFGGRRSLITKKKMFQNETILRLKR